MNNARLIYSEDVRLHEFDYAVLKEESEPLLPLLSAVSSNLLKKNHLSCSSALTKLLYLDSASYPKAEKVSPSGEETFKKEESRIKMQTKAILERLRQFDAYPKTLEDFRIKTFGGAAITIVSGLLMFVLFLSELNYYLTKDVQPELFVDISRGQIKMKINLNVTFHKMPCAYLSIDAMDISGENQIDVAHNLFKQRLNERGGLVEDMPEKHEELANENIIQCEREGWVDKLQKQKNEGCNVFGYIEVNKVGGNFHMAPGKSFQQSHVHVHDLQALGGEKTMFQYFIKVVPTTYTDDGGKTVFSNQFSATKHSKVIGAMGESGLPGLFVTYELSPMMVKYTEKR
ncbi:ERGI3-like protein, partial [Mya arenaria]